VLLKSILNQEMNLIIPFIVITATEASLKCLFLFSKLVTETLVPVAKNQ
jgi:hypothetical protein